MWLDDDTEAALAYIDYVRQDAAERCPRCATKPEDWFDENGRYLRTPKWETRIVECEGCRELDEVNEELGGDEDRSGKRAVFVRHDPDAEPQVHPDADE